MGHIDPRQPWREHFRKTLGDDPAALETAIDAAFAAIRAGSDKRTASDLGVRAALARRASHSSTPPAPRDPSRPPPGPPQQRAEPRFNEFMIPSADELSDWARLEEQKQIAQERIRWRVMRRTPMGRVSLVIGVIISLFVVALFAFIIFSVVTSPGFGLS